MQETTPAQPDQRLLVSVDEAALILSISRKQIYRLFITGELVGVHIGKRRLVPRDELQGYVERLKSAA
jgi:excisionase family DNA binding protein